MKINIPYINCKVFVRSLIIAGCLIVAPVFAHDVDGGFPSEERFYLRTGVFDVSNFDTTIRIDSSSGFVGTTIDFEDTLAVDDSLNVVRLDGYYRFNNRHSVAFNYFSFDRDGSVVVEEQLEFGDESFAISTVIETDIANTIFEVSYNYSLIVDQRVELEVGGGLHIDDIDIQLQSIQDNAFESASGSLPLPVLSFGGRYYFTPKLSLGSKIKQLIIEAGDIKGVFTDFELLLEYRAFKNVGVGLSFDKINLDLESSDQDTRGEYENTAKGFYFYASTYF